MSAEQRLVLVRHAKSSHPAGLDDHERPLDERGRVEAVQIGRRLAEVGWSPDGVVCSDAVRALSTWQRMAAAFGAVPVEVTRKLYHAGPDALEEVLADRFGAAEEADTRCVFAVGHNPGWEEVAHELSGVEMRLPTATAALLRRRVPTP